MKSKFLRILALILVMSSLISMFAIFAGAEEATGTEGENTETDQNSFELIYNRTYSEGWDVGNGMTLNGSDTSFKIDHEQVGEKYNYFWRMAIGTAGEYAELPGVAKTNVGSVIEFDIMVDAVTSASNPVVINTKGETDGETAAVDLMKITENAVYLLGAEEAAFTMEASKWYRIQLIFDYTGAKLTLNYVPVDGSSSVSVIENEGLQGNGITSVHFQSTEADAENAGQSICFDNVKYYEGTNAITEITAEMGYGSGIDEEYEKTETILGGSSDTGTNLVDALSMKVGVDYAYFNKERTPIFEKNGVAYGAPVKVDGEVMVPLLMVLKYIGVGAEISGDGASITVSALTPSVILTVGSKVANLGAEAVELDAAPAYNKLNESTDYLLIALDDVEKLFAGYYGDYDDMGYISVSKTPDMLDRSKNLNSMLDVMKKFVFDIYDGETLYNDLKDHTGFAHPYLLADANELAALASEYSALLNEHAENPFTEESEKFWKLRGYNSIVEAGEVAYRTYAALDENGTYNTYNGLLASDDIPTKYSLYMSNPTNAGYDKYGRSDITNRTELLEDMTYAYVLTGDTKYLEVAYELAINLGKWDHWGPGNFIDCADAASQFAIYYDWTYQGYKALGESGVTRYDGTEYDVTALAEILARQGVHEGYLSSIKNACDHPSSVVRLDNQDGFSYSKRKTSWSAACVSGMTMAALAIFDGNVAEAYFTEAKELVGANLQSLIDNGMDMYAPDGSYIEGPSHWNCGTNNLFRMCAALDTATGGNYGLMDCWGVDTTCYYACQTEDNNSNYFPYNDSTVGGYDTSYFFYVASYFGDATLYNIRLDQILGNLKEATLIDFIYYPTESDINGAAEIQLDYYSESMDLFVTRSSWEQDALYVSIMGGKNNDTYGQMDAGNFVYHNGGNVWICDIGAENSDCKGIWDTSMKYRYYVMKPEGNNTIAISGDLTGTPFGQLANAEAKATAWGSNEHGSYVTYDMGGTLGTQISKWERGMLLTNDRKTTVIQDQVNFKSMNTVYWFAHYNTSVVDGGITLSDDGRTAYMRDYLGTDEHGKKLYKTLRLSIVSDNQSYHFQLMTTYQYIHTSEAVNGKTNPTPTFSPDDISALGGASENRRDSYRKLAITSGEQLGFNIAVVIELVEDNTVGQSTEIDVGYEYQNMSNWVPYADERGLEIEEDTVDRRGTPNADIHLVESLRVIKEDIKDTLYTDDFDRYFECLADASYAINMIGSDMPDSYKDYVNEYFGYQEAFNAYRNAIVAMRKTQTKFVDKLMGLT